MMIYTLSTPEGDVTVSLDSATAEAFAEIQYEGKSQAIGLVREWLEREYGAYGHFIGEAAAPIDLAVAMKSDRAKQFTPKLVQGAELLTAPVKLNLPPGAVT